MRDFCICIRCHDYPEAVLDTIRTVKKYSITNPYIMLAIDNQDKYGIKCAVENKYPDIDYYVSDTMCGWGSGLYRLFVNALIYAERSYIFRHFICMDYDTIYTRKGADKLALKYITPDSTVLVGAKRESHTGHMGIIKRHWAQIRDYICLKEYSYEYLKSLNRYVLGAYMVLTRYGIEQFRERGYFDEPIKSCLKIKIPDDSWISLLAYSVGLVGGIPTYNEEKGLIPSPYYDIAVTWRMPVSIDDIKKYKLYIYHPVKGMSGGRKKLKREDIAREMGIRKGIKKLLGD